MGSLWDMAVAPGSGFWVLTLGQVHATCCMETNSANTPKTLQNRHFGEEEMGRERLRNSPKATRRDSDAARVHTGLSDFRAWQWRHE